MGFLDFIKDLFTGKNWLESERAAQNHNGSSTSIDRSQLSADELYLHLKKQFYAFSFSYYPKAIFSGVSSADAFIQAPAALKSEGLVMLLNGFNNSGGQLEAGDFERCGVDVFEGLVEGRAVMVVSFPDTDLPKDVLFLGAYMVAVVYDNPGFTNPGYFVLSQRPMGGGASVRRVSAEGMNINCGEGPDPELGAEAFAKAVMALLKRV